MVADLQTFGFPTGYFVIRSVATDRLWDVKADDVEDGTGGQPFLVSGLVLLIVIA